MAKTAFMMYDRIHRFRWMADELSSQVKVKYVCKGGRLEHYRTCMRESD